MEGTQNLEPMNFDVLKDTLVEPVDVDLGRESLGILPPDFQRESLGFSNTSFLNDLKQGFMQASYEFDRESLTNGKESLGILNFTMIDTNFAAQESTTPNIFITACNENVESANDIFNRAFIFPSPRAISPHSIASSLSFHSNSIEELSKISSISSEHLLQTVISRNYLSVGNNRLRIQSLPNMVTRSSPMIQLSFNEQVSDKSNNSTLEINGNVNRQPSSVFNEAKLFTSFDFNSLEETRNEKQFNERTNKTNKCVAPKNYEDNIIVSFLLLFVIVTSI